MTTWATWAKSWGASWGGSWGPIEASNSDNGAGGYSQRIVREVKHKTLLQRVLEARAERIKPVKKNARKRARVIEIQAAELAQSGGNEAQFRALMNEWLAQEPQLPQSGVDVEQLFMAQVAMAIESMARRAFEQDEEEALIALLFA